MRWFISFVVALAMACGETGEIGEHADHGDAHRAGEEVRGPNGGRLLESGDFTLELALFEGGGSAEFRAWVTQGDRPLAPEDVRLTASLARLGGVVNEISFSPSDGFLKGNAQIAEPHSFVVSIEAAHEDDTFRWQYENFEGRTRIARDVAETLGIETEIAGGAVIPDAVEVYGRIVPNREQVRELRARFGGVVRAVHAEIGARVSKGDKLLTIEGDRSLNRYTVVAPIAGVVTQRDANPGEQTSGRLLMTVTNTSSVWAELFLFPKDRTRVHVGSPVVVTPTGGGQGATGTISAIDVVARPDQSVIARAVLDNPNGVLVPGVFATARITVAEHEVPVAVRREGLQKFREFTVVYAQVGEEYEVRMLDLGRRSAEWVEVLGGLELGTRYVTKNSFVVKADIEKAGASHDH